MTSWLGVLLALVFVVLNGFFVAAEFAIVKVRGTQIAKVERRGDRRARRAQAVAARIESYLNATQLGITLSSLALGWIGEPAIADRLVPLLALIGVDSAATAHAIAIPIAFTVLSMLHILFGEMVPKSIGIRRSVDTALFTAGPLILFRWAFLPFLVVMDWLSGVVLRAMRFPPLKGGGGSLSLEEIQQLLDAEVSSGRLPEMERSIVARVIRSARRPVHLAMVPRMDVAFLSLESPADTLRARALEHGYSRLPVVEQGNLDRVLGYVHVRDLERAESSNLPLRDVVREMPFTPETTTVGELLQEVRLSGVPLAAVVDEYGGTKGIVTLEDLLEQIVGEIHDEFDNEAMPIVKLADGTMRVDGRVAIADVAAAAGVELPSLIHATVAGHVVETLGRLAKQGDRVAFGPLTMEVTQVRRRRIVEVVLRRDG